MAPQDTSVIERYDDASVRALVESLVREAVRAAQESGDIPAFEVEDAGVSRTADPAHGDWTSTVAMRSAKLAHRAPRDIALAVTAHMPADPRIASCEIAGPGFVNFRLEPAAVVGVFGQVRSEGASFGRSDAGAGRSIDVEYVSANPVGPMHVGHGRWAALGDSLCNVLAFVGWDVTREFYINDAGNQMNVFAASIEKRYRQICALVEAGSDADAACRAIEDDRLAAIEDAAEAAAENGSESEASAPVERRPHPLTDDFVAELGPDSYGGAYIVDVARAFYDEDGAADLAMAKDERLLSFRERGYAMMLANIKDVLSRCGCEFDVWFSERLLHTPGEDGRTAIEAAFDKLRAAGKLYEKDGAVWFRTTDYGDDKDRVLVKGDGSYTYFAADIAYHSNKLDRGFDRLVNILGADHHGYVPRIKAVVAAMGHPGCLDVLLGQLVNLLRNGTPVRMSKRRGTMVTFEEVLDEVGSDAARYTLLSRSTDQEVDFDVAKVQEESSDNPVYYVQYAHARICSILRKAAAEDPAAGDLASVDEIADALVGEGADLSLLTDPSEIALARVIARFGDVVAGCAKDLAPFRLTYYATELAAAFHGFYTNCHVLTADPELTRARLCACDAARRVLAATLGLIGVSAPVSMDKNH